MLAPFLSRSLHFHASTSLLSRPIFLSVWVRAHPIQSGKSVGAPAKKAAKKAKQESKKHLATPGASKGTGRGKGKAARNNGGTFGDSSDDGGMEEAGGKEAGGKSTPASSVKNDEDTSSAIRL